MRTLDENFLIVRRAANLAVSHDLAGFGTVICLIAEVLGASCYVIDFHLRHKSAGVMDDAFHSVRERLIRKYRTAFRSRWVVTTCSVQFVSRVPFLGRFLSSPIATRMVDRFLFSAVGRAFLSTWLQQRATASRTQKSLMESPLTIDGLCPLFVEMARHSGCKYLASGDIVHDIEA